MMRQRLVQVLRSADDGPKPDMDTVVRRFWSSAEAPRPNGCTGRVLDLVPRLQTRAAQKPRG
jgi:hypothetical protein